MTDPAQSSIAPQGPQHFERFAFIDALRGLGALGVACYHIYRYRLLRGPVDDILPDFLKTAFQYGWVGVPAFFVIAGFVAAYSLRNSPQTIGALGNFSLRRILRLGIPYWVTILIAVALNFVARKWWKTASLTGTVTWDGLAANMLFLQDILGYDNISAGTWFVCVDLQFGLLFAVLWWLARRLSRGYPDGGLAQTMALACLFVPLGLLSLFVFTLDARYNAWIIYFYCAPLLGVLGWWTLEKRMPASIFWSYALAMAGRAWMFERWRRETLLALAAGTIIYLMGRWGHLGDWPRARWLQYLGRISYSLFLIHYPVGWVVVTMGHAITEHRPAFAVVWLVLALVASIGAAHLMYVFVEAPSVRLVNRLKQRAGAA